MALELGRTVAELEQQLGSGELTEWIAFDSIEPFGAARSNWPSANLAAMFANLHRKKGTAPNKPKDFLWGAKDETKERQTQTTFALMDSMAVDKKDGPNKT